MAEIEFVYKGREVRVSSTLRAGGEYVFGVVINDETMNSGVDEGASTSEQALSDGSDWAKQYIDGGTGE